MPDTRDRLDDLFGQQADAAAPPRPERSTNDFLLFDLGTTTFAVTARQVEEVIAWRPPLPLPRVEPRVLGIIQDRGRIIVLLTPPTRDELATPLRIVICRTPRGYVGFPAGRTRCVDSVKVYGELFPKAVVDTSEGVVTYLDPTHLVAIGASGGEAATPAGAAR